MIITNSINLSRVVTELNSTLTFAFVLNSNGSSYNYPMETLPKSDYTKLMNISFFKFNLLNNCTSAPLLLILVHTAPVNYNRRKSIRETWGNKQAQVAVLFMLGSVTDAKVQRRLEEENKKYNDIIQGSFIDVYRNITYKHVMTLKYAIYHCPQAKYILKTDDDVFVNMPTMLDFLTLDLSPNGAKGLLLCSKQATAAVSRSYRSKWRVSFTEYEERYYPPYCPGWIIMYSPDVVFTLYREVQKSKYFWIDDVLITGFIRSKQNIMISDISSLVLHGKTMKKVFAHERRIANTPMFLFGPVNLSVKDIYRLNEVVKNGTSYKCMLSFIK